MKNLKDVLTTALGWGGYILWFILSSWLTFAPIWMLDFPFWISFIAIAAYFSLPVLGSFMMLVLWIWSFAVSFVQPLGLFTILYYVAAVIYLLGYLIPFITMIATWIAPRPKHYFWENAPIRYYKFLVYFGLIFSILSTLGNTISNYQNYNWLSWALDFLSIGVLFFSWIELKHKKWSGAVALCSLNLMNAIVSSILSIFLIIINAEPAGTIIIALASLALCILLWIYFCKRRPLFSPWYQEEDDISSCGGYTNGSERDYDAPGPELQLDLDGPDFHTSGQFSEQYDSAVLPQESAVLMHKQKNRISTSAILLTVACLLLLVISACSIFYGVKKNAECEALKTDVLSYENKIKALQNREKELVSKNEKLQEDNDDLAQKWLKQRQDLLFFYNKIGFIVDGSLCYHSFDCPIVREADGYFAHNIKFCEGMGYIKCADCFSGP